MTERTYVVQKTQIGVETTPGTAVAANKRLMATTLEFEPQATVQEFTPLGNKYVTIAAEQKEWMQLAMKGYPSFDDLVYLYSSLLSAATVTSAGVGHKWAFDSAVSALDAPKTFTIEQGDAVRAQRVAGSIIKDLGLKVTRSAADVSGSAIGTRMTDGITLTSSPTELPIQPLLASNFDLFIDPSDGTSTPPFGTTKVARLFDSEFNLNNRYGPFWVVDSTQTSYAGTVELMPKYDFKIIVEADVAGMGYLNTLRVGSTVMARLRNIGPLMSDMVTNWSFTQDMALKVSALGKYSDQEGVYAFEYTFTGVEDLGWGKSIHTEIVTDIAAL